MPMSRAPRSENAESMWNNLPSDTVREVVEHARSLDPEDERVSLIDGGDVTVDREFPLNRATLSTLLFTATVTRSDEIPAGTLGEDCPSGELHVNLKESMHFDGYGDGHIRFGITADPETREVESMTISRVLTAETQRALA